MFALLFAVVFFYTTHSLLASVAAKAWAARKLGLGRWYRLFYSTVSVLQVLLVIWLLVKIPPTPVMDLPTFVRGSGLVVLLAGSLLSVASVVRFGALGFLGLRDEQDNGLVRSGLHGRVRHPIYAGLILAALGWVLFTPTLQVLMSVMLTFIYLPIGIHLEERKLISQFGEEYLRYRVEVPALFPNKKWKST